MTIWVNVYPGFRDKRRRYCDYPTRELAVEMANDKALLYRIKVTLK